MKYNTLLVGSQDYIIDEFFFNMQDRFDCVTTSARMTDFKKHLKVFHPQLLIVCVNGDSVELANVVHKLKAEIKQEDTIVVVIGETADVNAFNNQNREPADITLERPLTNSAILQRIDDYWDDREQKRNAEKRMQEEAMMERHHILVVDDDPNMLKTIKAQLEGEYNVATAVNGSLALRFLTKKTTDLILLDYEMPGQSGDTVFSILRMNEQTKNIPVIFLTGVADPAKIAKVLALKPQGYMLKPIDSGKLLKTIKDVIAATYGDK